MRRPGILRHLLLPLAATLTLAACLPVLEPGAKPPPLTVVEGEPLLQVAAPALGGKGLMKRVGQNGAVETWMSIDRYALSLQGGIVVATRGFGFDLMASDASASLKALALGNVAAYGRSMRYLTSDNRSVWLRAMCEMARAGREAGLQRFNEKCQTRDDEFTNRYWLDDRGHITRSRQWISPELGYFDIGPAG